MSDFVGIRLEGGNELRRTLRRAGYNMKDLTAINRKAAVIVAAQAKATAPTGPPANGHIASTVRAGATQKAAIVRVGDAKRPYAHVIHWGWAKRNISANPWVSVAAQSTEGTWVELYWTDLMNAINSISGD